MKHWFTSWWRKRFYVIRLWMKWRCTRKSDSWYLSYWWKWIKIEWYSFQEFRDDMYESYLEHVKKFWEKETTIDRIDNNFNYCKENCRRATYKEQANNKRNNIIIYVLDKKYSVNNFSLLYNIPINNVLSFYKIWYSWIDMIVKSFCDYVPICPIRKKYMEDIEKINKKYHNIK